MRWVIASGLFLLVAVPLGGGVTKGLSGDFFRYPPLLNEAPGHASFSWPVFSLFALLGGWGMTVLIFPRWYGFQREPAGPPVSKGAHTPWWGYAGLLIMAAFWVIAWWRPPVLGPVNDHTFFPLWLGFILFLDGLVFRLRSTSLLSRSRAWFITLFLCSTISWWYFEFLNRFVQNWYYEGNTPATAFHYLFYSSLCFSTVFPAMFEITELLLCTNWFQRSFRRGPAWQPRRRFPGQP